MCGRFVLAFTKAELENASGTNKWINEEKFHPSYNVAPTSYVPVVRTCKHKERQENAHRVLHVMKWGLRPFWSRGDSKAVVNNCINARKETLLEKNLFKVPLTTGGRGILIVNGFYEWQKESVEKIPYFISTEEGPLYMAVVYDVRKEEANEQGEFTIVTVDASPSVAWLHDRMPALLTPNLVEEWLDTKRFSPEEAVTLLKPFDGNLKVQLASPRVNQVKNDGVELISYKRPREETIRPSQSRMDSFFSSSSRKQRSQK